MRTAANAGDSFANHIIWSLMATHISFIFFKITFISNILARRFLTSSGILSNIDVPDMSSVTFPKLKSFPLSNPDHSGVDHTIMRNHVYKPTLCRVSIVSRLDWPFVRTKDLTISPRLIFPELCIFHTSEPIPKFTRSSVVIVFIKFSPNIQSSSNFFLSSSERFWFFLKVSRDFLSIKVVSLLFRRTESRFFDIPSSRDFSTNSPETSPLVSIDNIDLASFSVLAS